MNFVIEFVVCILGCMTIGNFWLGNVGMVLGLFFGIYLLYLLRKRRKKNIDYDRIEKMIQRNK